MSAGLSGHVPQRVHTSTARGAAMTRWLMITLPVYVLVSGLCYYAAFLLRLDFELSSLYPDVFLHSLPLVLAAKLLAFWFSGDWQRDPRYYGLQDVLSFVTASAVATASLFLLNCTGAIGTGASLPIPRSVIVIDGVLQIAAFGLVRAAPRIFRETVGPAFSSSGRLRTLIYGGDQEGIGILKALQTSNREYKVVGFVSPYPNSSGRIAGVRVYRPEGGWRNLVEQLRANCLLIPSDVPRRTIRAIISDCAGLGVEVHVIPGVTDIARGRFCLGVRDIAIADLLRRQPAILDRREIGDSLAGKRVLVTGAAGSIGSELCRQLLDYAPASLILADQSELGIFNLEQEFRGRVGDATGLHPVMADISDGQGIERVICEHRPQVIFHAAAYKHVPLLETNVQAAVRNNVLGTKLMADLAVAFEVEQFVLVSTDKAVHPSSVMGATKFLAEKYVQSLSIDPTCRFITVRFGNVLNSTGSVIPTFRRQIESGGPVTVTHPEMRRFFMSIPEACELVLQAGAIGRSGDVFVFEMGDAVKIVDLAKHMIRLSGQRFPDDIDIVYTGPRPGEKLHEQLFYHSEQGFKKVRDKIFRARPVRPDAMGVRQDLMRLAATLGGTPDETRDELWRIVNRYINGAELRPRQRVAA
jgi:FlaA1/EpsC-like NDP-sugar epimerase